MLQHELCRNEANYQRIRTPFFLILLWLVLLLNSIGLVTLGFELAAESPIRRKFLALELLEVYINFRIIFTNNKPQDFLLFSC